jgi:dephospho-CoA kinase
MRPFCVGLTGGIGSGKSQAAGRFAQLGAGVVDTDVIARELTAPAGAAMPALLAVFGTALRGSDGGLDRAAMRALAFADPQARARLEAILHPLIRSAAARQVEASDTPYAVLVVPLLVEHLAEYQGQIDRLLLVDCDESLQLVRAMNRPGLDAAQVRAIMASQASRAQRRACADEVIDNNSDLDSLLRQVDALHLRYLGLADESRRKARA